MPTENTEEKTPASVYSVGYVGDFSGAFAVTFSRLGTSGSTLELPGNPTTDTKQIFRVIRVFRGLKVCGLVNHTDSPKLLDFDHRSHRWTQIDRTCRSSV